MKKLLTLSALLFGLSAFTGCETVKETLYEPVPYDEVAAQRGITLEEAEALGLVRPRTSVEPLINAVTSFSPAPGVAWRHPSSLSWEVAGTKHKPKIKKGTKHKPTMETLNSNPAGIHSRAEGLTSHRKRVLRSQSRGWHEA